MVPLNGNEELSDFEDKFKEIVVVEEELVGSTEWRRAGTSTALVAHLQQRPASPALVLLCEISCI
jgi:hypothetical protein